MLHFHDGLVLNGRFYTFYFFSPSRVLHKLKFRPTGKEARTYYGREKKKILIKKNGFDRRFRIKLIHIPRQIV